MGREVKFRAFIKSLKWMLPVERIYFDYKTVEVDLSYGNGDTSEYELDEVELMQLTGRKDKNGTDIYEGDLIRSGDRLVEVFWSKIGSGSWWFATRGKDGSRCHAERINLDDLEVVGNIHEKLKILEVAK